MRISPDASPEERERLEKFWAKEVKRAEQRQVDPIEKRFNRQTRELVEKMRIKAAEEAKKKRAEVRGKIENFINNRKLELETIKLEAKTK